MIYPCVLELVSQSATCRPLVFKLTAETGKELKIGVYEQDGLQEWTTKIREASKMADEKVMCCNLNVSPALILKHKMWTS